MKLYTRPRPVPARYVQDTDQVAVTPAGKLVRTVEQYVELDMAGEDGDKIGVEWARVLSSHPDPDSRGWTITHTRCVQDRIPYRADVIIREVIELDPWSYVRT